MQKKRNRENNMKIHVFDLDADRLIAKALPISWRAAGYQVWGDCQPNSQQQAAIANTFIYLFLCLAVGSFLIWPQKLTGDISSIPGRHFGRREEMLGRGGETRKGRGHLND